jgi:hypothetical protein
MKLRILLAGLVVMAAAACTPKAPPPQPQPQPQPRPQPVPRPLPPPPPVSQDWRDLPLTQGNWYYSAQAGSTQALFGPANSEAAFIVRCDRSRRQITISREGAATGNIMTIRTTGTARNYPLSVQAEPLNYVYTTTSPADRFLDEMVFSRGRFSVEVSGTPRLLLPTWPEPARVVEDCRS